MVKEEIQWANPGALGLAGFGFNTMLLQIHNIGLIEGTLPLIFGFFWGGVAQVIAGIIDGRRGDTFGLTAFTSYGLFWIGLSLAFLLEWTGVVELDSAGLAWTFIFWGIFTAFMTIGTFKMSRMHVFVFSTLTLLFFLLAAHFFDAIPAIVPGIEGLICGAAAAYGSAAVVLQSKYGRWVLPIGSY
ncbi:MAG: acetate uptake transporter [Dehalococcoidales bacterium]|nr:acetate uptake transporter [Dehalococcoidales bacterium]